MGLVSLLYCRSKTDFAYEITVKNRSQFLYTNYLLRVHFSEMMYKSEVLFLLQSFISGHKPDKKP